MKKPVTYGVDTNRMCDIKGRLHAYVLDSKNVFLACNKLKLDFCEDILGTRNVIGNTPHDLLCTDIHDSEALAACHAENTNILNSRIPKQFFHRWVVKGQYRLDLLTLKTPLFDMNGKAFGVWVVSHFVNRFCVNKAYSLGLSKRETECLFFLLEGYTAKEIGSHIKISPRTIEGYIDNMKTKLNCPTTSELLIKALHEEVQDGVDKDILKLNTATAMSNPLSDSIDAKTIFSTIDAD